MILLSLLKTNDGIVRGNGYVFNRFGNLHYIYHLVACAVKKALLNVKENIVCLTSLMKDCDYRNAA
jgi:hypothetical protein